MPIYAYRCPNCEHRFEVYKSVRYINNIEHCEKCSTISNRVMSLTNFSGADDWNTQHFSPALGKWVKSNSELRREAKRRGLEEVGNEKPETLHKIAEKRNQEIRDNNMNLSYDEHREAHKILKGE